MPTYIVKLQHKQKSYYMEWSTVVDAPVTFGMPLAEFTEYYRAKYGKDDTRNLPHRLARVEIKGTSAIGDNSAEETIAWNSAGKDATCITVEQIIEWYCLKRKDCEIKGRQLDESQ